MIAHEKASVWLSGCLPVFIKGWKVTADDVIKRDAGREEVEGCRGIDDGFGRGYLSIQ